jgi:adenylate kinase
MSTPLTINDRATWMAGAEHTCSVGPQAMDHPWRIVLLGAPGVGKGTQAQLLAGALHACHLSTGDVLRAAKSAEHALSQAMTLAVNCMRAGKLVPDQTILDLVRERSKCLRCSGGFILDGFPRTVPQAQALETLLREQGVGLDAVVDYVMPVDQIVARLSGRRTCPQCKAVYHTQTRRPKQEGICDLCGTGLKQREDDRPEAIRVRMATYQEATAPLTAYYKTRGVLVEVDASGIPEAIATAATGALFRRRDAAS